MNRRIDRWNDKKVSFQNNFLVYITNNRKMSNLLGKRCSAHIAGKVILKTSEVSLFNYCYLMIKRSNIMV